MPFALKKTRGLKPWQPGQSGNPKGRPVGSRNKLATLVFDEALTSFEKRGPAAFEELANKDPARYLILMATNPPAFQARGRTHDHGSLARGGSVAACGVAGEASG